MLKTSSLSVDLSGRPVLHGVTLGFAPGRFTAVMGANGSGKTTLLKALMGFVPAAQGQVTLDGGDARRLSRKAFARRIAYLPQENACPDYMTLGELVELAGYARFGAFGGPSAEDRAHFQAALETVGLGDMAHLRMSTLSGGQRQRAWIAMTLAQGADILMMDEPVNHLDLKYQHAVLTLVRRLVRDEGKTVIMVLHDLNLALAFADDLALLRDGALYGAGVVREVITAQSVRDVFDVEADIFTRKGQILCALLGAQGGE